MEKLLTRWGRILDSERPLPEYPRPQLRRSSYFNLNGLWNYAILPMHEEFSGYQGTIVVPFSPETVLSGVEQILQPDQVLYYQKIFIFHRQKDRVLLHFGAVDYSCRVTLNGRVLGSHQGGYLPFSFDITDSIQEGENDLRLEVTDPTDTGTQARGKQTFKRGGIWYTPQSGIWQTVWMEEVCANYIESIRLTPDIDEGTLTADLKFIGDTEDGDIIVLDGETVTARGHIIGGHCVIPIPKQRLWSPEDPQLYDLKITAGEDSIESYFAMRKFSIGEDREGIPRIMLNNRPYFMNGLLDQGYWSDGMYTAPSDEALVYDIQTMKELGFNTLRKHIKIEPLRWYYHCDRLGMIVWQDMVSGGGKYSFAATAFMPMLSLIFNNKHIGRITDGRKHRKFYARQDEKGIQEFYRDSAEMIDLLYNVPSLALWTPINEGWGQFDSLKICSFYREKDPTRLIDHASGWVDHGGGDINSFHIYFTPIRFVRFSSRDRRPIGLTEYGGYSIKTPGHVFDEEKTFGYRVYETQAEFDGALKSLMEDKIYPAISKKRLSAAIYTEVSDVEDELNGLMTFDREVLKVTPEIIRSANEKLKLP